MKLMQKNGYLGVAELGGVRREINLMLVPDVHIGDFVVIHAGSAIAILDEAEAVKTLDLLEEMTGEDPREQ